MDRRSHLLQYDFIRTKDIHTNPISRQSQVLRSWRPGFNLSFGTYHPIPEGIHRLGYRRRYLEVSLWTQEPEHMRTGYREGTEMGAHCACVVTLHPHPTPPPPLAGSGNLLLQIWAQGLWPMKALPGYLLAEVFHVLHQSPGCKGKL